MRRFLIFAASAGALSVASLAPAAAMTGSAGVRGAADHLGPVEPVARVCREVCDGGFCRRRCYRTDDGPYVRRRVWRDRYYDRGPGIEFRIR